MIQSIPHRKMRCQSIDAAKCGKINNYENYPEVFEEIKEAAGGKKSRMPAFFKYSRNGRSADHQGASYAKANRSTMNRICMKFMDMPNINMNYANVPPFNWQMLMRSDISEYNITAIKIFCDMDDSNVTSLIQASNFYNDNKMKANVLSYDLLRDSIIHELNTAGISLEKAYPSIVKYLFTGDMLDKPSHKQMFWRVFGDIACETLKYNMEHSHECPNCRMKIPDWVHDHSCQKLVQKGFFICVDCGTLVERKGPKQCRCPSCQEKFGKQNVRNLHRKYNTRKKKGA